MKIPQTTIAPTFLTHIISGIDGVIQFYGGFEQKCQSNFFQFSLLPSLISGPLEY